MNPRRTGAAGPCLGRRRDHVGLGPTRLVGCQSPRKPGGCPNPSLQGRQSESPRGRGGSPSQALPGRQPGPSQAASPPGRPRRESWSEPRSFRALQAESERGRAVRRLSHRDRDGLRLPRPGSAVPPEPPPDSESLPPAGRHWQSESLPGRGGSPSLSRGGSPSLCRPPRPPATVPSPRIPSRRPGAADVGPGSPPSPEPGETPAPPPPRAPRLHGLTGSSQPRPLADRDGRGSRPSAGPGLHGRLARGGVTMGGWGGTAGYLPGIGAGGGDCQIPICLQRLVTLSSDLLHLGRRSFFPSSLSRAQAGGGDARCCIRFVVVGCCVWVFGWEDDRVWIPATGGLSVVSYHPYLANS
jgi:hypothetical protein